MFIVNCLNEASVFYREEIVFPYLNFVSIRKNIYISVDVALWSGETHIVRDTNVLIGGYDCMIKKLN